MWNLNLLQPDKSIYLLHNKESWHMCYISSPCYLVECLTSIPLRSSTWNFSLMQTVCKQPYAVAFAHHPLFLKELTHLSGIGAWKWLGHQNWEPPCYPFQDIWHHSLVSTFRGFNWFIKPKVYPQIITDVLHRWCSGYKYYQFGYYYAFELDNESRQVCVIVTPFGNYQYNWLPLGIN